MAKKYGSNFEGNKVDKYDDDVGLVVENMATFGGTNLL